MEKERREEKQVDNDKTARNIIGFMVKSFTLPIAK